MRKKVHMILWHNREIEVRHGTRHIFSMWGEVGVYMSMEIVLERFRKGRVSWEPVSWKGSAISGVWLQAIPYLRFSKE